MIIMAANGPVPCRCIIGKERGYIVNYWRMLQMSGLYPRKHSRIASVCVCVTYRFEYAHNEIGLDVGQTECLLSVCPVAVGHFEFAIEEFQRCVANVNAPWQAAALHFVSQFHVFAVHVELPLFLA